MKVLCIATCHLIDGGHNPINEPIREISNHRIYRNGEFSIVKICTNDYAVLWKNVIIGEFVGPNKDLCDRLVTKCEPEKTDYMQHYNYINALSGIEESEKWANLYHFTIS